MKGAAKPPTLSSLLASSPRPLSTFSTGQAPERDREQVHHLVQVPDEHLVLVDLVGLAELTDPGLHLLPQDVIELDVHQQAPLGFLEGLELVGEASNQLRLS